MESCVNLDITTFHQYLSQKAVHNTRTRDQTRYSAWHAILTIGVNTHFLHGDNFFCTPDGMHYTAIGELALRFDLGDAERMRIG